jgi:hypothetical protein
MMPMRMGRQIVLDFGGCIGNHALVSVNCGCQRKMLVAAKLGSCDVVVWLPMPIQGFFFVMSLLASWMKGIVGASVDKRRKQ